MKTHSYLLAISMKSFPVHGDEKKSSKEIHKILSEPPKPVNCLPLIIKLNCFKTCKPKVFFKNFLMLELLFKFSLELSNSAISLSL